MERRPVIRVDADEGGEAAWAAATVPPRGLKQQQQQQLQGVLWEKIGSERAGGEFMVACDRCRKRTGRDHRG